MLHFNPMPALLITVTVFIFLSVIGALAFAAWVQITRDVIAEETDEEEAGGGAPAVSRDLEQALWREHPRAQGHGRE